MTTKLRNECQQSKPPKERVFRSRCALVESTPDIAHYADNEGADSIRVSPSSPYTGVPKRYIPQHGADI